MDRKEIRQKVEIQLAVFRSCMGGAILQPVSTQFDRFITVYACINSFNQGSVNTLEIIITIIILTNVIKFCISICVDLHISV